MDYTKLRLIWAVFWVCIISPIYAMLSCITRQYQYVGTINNDMWPCLHWFWMLNLVLTFSWPLTITMRPTSSAKHSSVLSLLMQGYSHHQMHTKTGVSLCTISKIGKEVDSTKENNPEGCLSTLSAWDNQSTIHQITSGKLDNAVQATQFINKTPNNPIHPQTVWNALKEAGLWSAAKKKVPMLKQTHWYTLLHFHNSCQLRLHLHLSCDYLSTNSIPRRTIVAYHIIFVPLFTCTFLRDSLSYSQVLPYVTTIRSSSVDINLDSLLFISTLDFVF